MPAPVGGIQAILYALFDAECELCWPSMARQIDLCTDAGVDGIVGLASQPSLPS